MSTLHRFRSTQGIGVSYADDYFGPPWNDTPDVVLFAHGTGESHAVWYAWMPEFAGRFRVLRPDMPGFGASRVPADVPFSWSAASMAGTLAELLDHAGVDAVHFVGAKYGGSVGVEFATRFPDRTRTLTVISGPMRIAGTDGSVDVTTFAARIDADLPRWVEETMDDRLGRSVSPDQRQWWTRMMAASDVRATRESAIGTVELELLDALTRITAPTLFISSAGNRMISEATYRDWIARAPNAMLEMVAGDSYHPAAANASECVTATLAHVTRGV